MNVKRAAVALTAGVAAALAFTAQAPGSVSVGHSGWKWGNPLPQGNTIRVVDFNSGTGYAAGDFGTLLKTTDAGATWTGIPTGITSALDRIDVISPNTIVIGGACSARRSDDGGATFHRLPFTPSELSCSWPSSRCRSPLGPWVSSCCMTARCCPRATAAPASRARPRSPTARRRDAAASAPTDIFFTSATNGVAVSSATGRPAASTTRSTAATRGPRCRAGRGVQRGVVRGRETGYAVGDGSRCTQPWTAAPRGSSGRSPGRLRRTHLDSLRRLICLLADRQGQPPRAQHRRRLHRPPTSSPSTLQIFAAAFASPSQAVAAGQDGATVVSGDAGVTFSPVPATGGRIAGPFLRLQGGQRQRGVRHRAQRHAGAHGRRRRDLERSRRSHHGRRG